jgi:hypothetical protein
VRGEALDPAGPVLLRPTISPFELTGAESAVPVTCQRLISPYAIASTSLSLVLHGPEQMQVLFTRIFTQGLGRSKE